MADVPAAKLTPARPWPLPQTIVRAGIQVCTRCPLHKAGHGPVPFRGPVPARYAIMGEAPGQEEDKGGKPFIGPAGKLLTGMLDGVGLDPDQAFIFNTVSCWPGVVRTPRTEHIDACWFNARMQLDVSQARFCLVLGNTALHHWWPDAKIGQWRGEPWTERTDLTLFPTYHPAAVLRNRALTWRWKEDLREFARLVTDGS